MGKESNGAMRLGTGRRGPRPHAPWVRLNFSSVAKPGLGLLKEQFPAHPKHVYEDPRGGVPRSATVEEIGEMCPRAMPASSIVASPSASPVPDTSGEAASASPRGTRPNQAVWCHRGEDRSSTATSAAPKGG